MNKKRPTPDPSAAKSGRTRTVPTIDLKATEVASEAQPEAAADAEPPNNDVNEVKDEAQQASGQDIQNDVQDDVQQESVEQAPVGQDPFGQETLASEQADPESSEPEQAAAEPAETIETVTTPIERERAASGGTKTGAVLAGIVGAAVMSLLFGALWLGGYLPMVNGGTSTLGASLPDNVTAQIESLEKQVSDLQNRSPAAGANGTDTKAIDALTQRVAKVEDAIKNIPADASAADPALAKRVVDAENAMKSLGVTLTALTRRSDEIAANTAQARERADAAEKAATELRASLQDVSKTASAGASASDLNAQQERIAALEQSVKTAKDELAKVAVTASAPDTTARLALTAAALRDAVLRGAPYNDELAQAKSLGGDEKILAPLAPFAASGVPGEKTLAQELSALLPGMRKAAGAQKPSGSFLERLKDNASQLVRVRPLDAPPGDDTAAVLTRVEIAASRADIPAALADLGKLTEAQRAPAQAWIAKANNRQAALAASRQFAADAARSLGSR